MFQGLRHIASSSRSATSSIIYKQLQSQTTASASAVWRSPQLVRSFSSTPASLISYVDPKPKIPPPTEKIPDVAAFLTAIGRGSDSHLDNFETWESLMKMTSSEMKGKGIDVRARK